MLAYNKLVAVVFPHARALQTAVRTGGDDSGAAGVSLLVIDRKLPGITIRKMETQFDNSHSTTFITFEDVIVPVRWCCLCCLLPLCTAWW